MARKPKSSDALDIGDRRIAIVSGARVVRVVFAPSPSSPGLATGESAIVHDEAGEGWTMDERGLLHPPAGEA